MGICIEQQGLQEYETVQCSLSTMLCYVLYAQACVAQHKHRIVPKRTVPHRTLLHQCSKARIRKA